MQSGSDQGPLIDLGEVAEGRPAETVREELDATSTGQGSNPPDTGGVVSPDHSQAEPEPDTGDVVPRDHPPVAAD